MRSAAAAAVRERDKINESAKDGLNSFVSFLSAICYARHIFTIVCLNCCVRNHSIFGLCIIRWVLEFQAHVDPTIFIGCCFFLWGRLWGIFWQIQRGGILGCGGFLVTHQQTTPLITTCPNWELGSSIHYCCMLIILLCVHKCDFLNA